MSSILGDRVEDAFTEGVCEGVVKDLSELMTKLVLPQVKDAIAQRDAIDLSPDHYTVM